MILKELFDTFHIFNRVRLISYSPYIELEGMVDRKDIPKHFKPYLNYKIKEINVDTEISGQCCGVDIETPYLEVAV